MKIPSTRDMVTLIEHWRSLVPKRPLTYGEHLGYGREQAHHLRALIDENEPAINLDWLFEQTIIPVSFVPSYTLDENSGLTTGKVAGKLQIFINESEPRRRQRHTLLHEWKHALDFYDQTVLYQNLGTGDPDIQHDHIEAIANDFAAHVLMPTELVTRVWFDTRNVVRTAGIFNVSREAMRVRLEILGHIPRLRNRWRAVGMIHETHPSLTLCAA